MGLCGPSGTFLPNIQGNALTRVCWDNDEKMLREQNFVGYREGNQMEMPCAGSLSKWQMVIHASPTHGLELGHFSVHPPRSFSINFNVETARWSFCLPCRYMSCWLLGYASFLSMLQPWGGSSWHPDLPCCWAGVFSGQERKISHRVANQGRPCPGGRHVWVPRRAGWSCPGSRSSMEGSWDEPLQFWPHFLEDLDGARIFSPYFSVPVCVKEILRIESDLSS